MFNQKIIVFIAPFFLMFFASNVLARIDKPSVALAQNKQSPQAMRLSKASQPTPIPEHQVMVTDNGAPTNTDGFDDDTASTHSAAAPSNDKATGPNDSSDIASSLANMRSEKPKAPLIGRGANARIQVNGFASGGVSRSNTSSKYRIPGRGSIDNHYNFAANSLLGLQVTAHITPQWAGVLQLVADGDDLNGNNRYHVQADWAFLRYQPLSGLQLRAGRFRLPAFLYSDTQQVGYSYPWVTLPNEVYRIIPFNNINGVDMIYFYSLGNTGWSLKIQPYFGENKSKFDLYTTAPAAFLPPGTTATFDENNILGGVVSLGNEYFTLRGNYTHAKISGTVPLGGARVPLFRNDRASFYSAGAKLDYDNFLAIAEWAHRSTPDQLASLTGYYGTLGYRIGKFLPTITYADIKTTNASRLLAAQPFAELPESQQSYTLGLDYYLNSNLVLKLGVSRITPKDGTNGLFTSMPGRPHVYLYSASLDAIF